MKPSVPVWISRGAFVVGAALFLITLLLIDWEATMRDARALGVWLPLVLLPGAVWHLVRALGWHISFPPEVRPSYWRIFRVRLAADGVAYFTVRGVASEPLRVLLLLDRVPPEASTAATILERTAMGVVSVVLVGVTSFLAVRSAAVPDDWQAVFLGLALAAIVVVALTVLLLTRRGRYVGPLFERLYRLTGWHWTEGRVAHFITEVERLLLELARTDPQRLRNLVLLAVAAYALMVLEVWIVFWAIRESISVQNAVFVETFTRSASVVGGVIPANLGALEASNVVVVQALGLAGAGTLALSRRVRGLLWAALGLLIYPRDVLRPRPKETR